MKRIKPIAAIAACVLSIAGTGCAHSTMDAHTKTLSTADYQQNIAKINSDSTLSPPQKQQLIDEFKEHVKQAPPAGAQ